MLICQELLSLEPLDFVVTPLGRFAVRLIRDADQAYMRQSAVDPSGQNTSEDRLHHHASEPAATDSLRPIPIQTHRAESFVSGTADAVPLSSSTP